MIPTDARLIRFEVKASQMHHGRALYRVIVERARRLGVAGASVLPVEYSLDSHGVIGDLASDYSAHEVPVLVEIVDIPERIAALLDELGPLRDGLPITIETVRALFSGPKSTPP